MATGSRIRALAGRLSVLTYVAALTAMALEYPDAGPALSSSPAGVAAGRLVPLLSSGLVVDGPAWPQIALLGCVLVVALRHIGAIRMWSAALCAHVGATLLAYVAVALLWIVDTRSVHAIAHAADYGISVVLAGELGALLATTRWRPAIPAGCLLLAVPAAAGIVVTGTVDPFALANIEHTLGFALGALVQLGWRGYSSAGRMDKEIKMAKSAPAANPDGPLRPGAHRGHVHIRRYEPQDEETTVALSLRAWAPVFASLEDELGHESFRRLRGDWRMQQAQAVRDTLADDAMQVWVGENERHVIAFVAATLHKDSLTGEISMLAVDPDHQQAGMGTALTECATNWFQRSGMRLAIVETGGDGGHAPARRVYDKAGYTPLAVVRYFKSLEQK